MNEDLQRIRDAYLANFKDDRIQELVDKIGRAPGKRFTSVNRRVKRTHKNGPEEEKNHRLSFIDHILEENGFLDENDRLPPSTHISLDDIHPIFAFQRFDKTLLGTYRMKKVYNAMRPALALATKLLTAPEARKFFWHRLYFGKLTRSKMQPNGTGKVFLTPSPTDFEQADKEFDRVLNDVAERLSFSWHPSISNCDGLCARDFISHVSNINDPLAQQIYKKCNDTGRKHLFSFAPCISLDANVLYHLLRPGSPARMGSDGPWNTTNMRLQLSLSQKILHELCHALWYHREGKNFTPEPYLFQCSNIPEVGLCWNYFFGGALLDLNLRPERIGPMTSRSRSSMHMRPGLSAVVQQHWVEAWFLKYTWTPSAHSQTFRMKALWGRAQSTGDEVAPKFWVAERVVRGPTGKPDLFPILYIDNKLAERQGLSQEAIKNLSGPGKDQQIEPWFWKKRDADLNEMREDGWTIPTQTAWGDYEYLQDRNQGLYNQMLEDESPSPSEEQKKANSAGDATHLNEDNRSEHGDRPCSPSPNIEGSLQCPKNGGETEDVDEFLFVLGNQFAVLKDVSA